VWRALVAKIEHPFEGWRVRCVAGEAKRCVFGLENGVASVFVCETTRGAEGEVHPDEVYEAVILGPARGLFAADNARFLGS
jgi:hypothetical protein